MSAILFANGKQYYALPTGVPNVGGKVFTYAAGTSTPQATWTDAAQTVPNTNPVILDARGEAVIFWSGNYKVVLKDALDNIIWTVDNVSAFPPDNSLRPDLAASSGSSLVGFIQSGAGAVARQVQTELRERFAVTQFGATGSTNDTAAVQSAINAASTPLGDGYFFDPYRPVVTPARQYGTGALTIAAPIAFGGEGMHATSYYMNAASASPHFTITGRSISDSAESAFNDYTSIGHMNISGTGTDATSHGVSLPYPGYALATRYCVGALIDDLWIYGYGGYGLNVGENRNNNFMNRMLVRYCRLSGYRFRDFDSHLMQLESGNNGTAGTAGEDIGFHFTDGGGRFLTSVSSYMNGVGFSFNNDFATNNIVNAAADANQKQGVYMDMGSNQQMSNAFVAMRFTGQSAAATNTHSDVTIVNAPTPPILAATMHVKNNVTVPKYLVEFGATTDFAVFSANAFSMDAVPWGTAISNYPTNLILVGNKTTRASYATGDAQNIGLLSGSNFYMRWGPTGLSFFDGTQTGRQTVTGSRGGNAALASLLSALHTIGLITDSTTP